MDAFKEETTHTLSDGTQITCRLCYSAYGDLENPADFMGWTLYSFSSRHTAYSNPRDLLEDEHGNLPIGLRRKLETGTAFLLGHFEHGRCQWALSGEQWQCPWDSVGVAGLLVMEDKPARGETYEQRQERARAFCEVYTAYCNGDEIGFTVTHEDGDGDEIEDVDGCWGYYGGTDDEHAWQEALDAARRFADEYEEALRQDAIAEDQEKARLFAYGLQGVLTS